MSMLTMKAILTKFHPPTARFIASDLDNNRVTMPNDSNKSVEQNHRDAADLFCHKMKWSGRLVAGKTKEGFAFCFDDTERIDPLQHYGKFITAKSKIVNQKS